MASKNVYKSNLGYWNFYKINKFLKFFCQYLYFRYSFQIRGQNFKIRKINTFFNFSNFFKIFQSAYFRSSFQIGSQNFKIHKINKFFTYLKIVCHCPYFRSSFQIRGQNFKIRKINKFFKLKFFCQYPYFRSGFQIRGQNFKIRKSNKFFNFFKFKKNFVSTLIFGLVSKSEVRISKFEKLINFVNFKFFSVPLFSV